jgi:hypothetical protein
MTEPISVDSIFESEPEPPPSQPEPTDDSADEDWEE